MRFFRLGSGGITGTTRPLELKVRLMGAETPSPTNITTGRRFHPSIDNTSQSSPTETETETETETVYSETIHLAPNDEVENYVKRYQLFDREFLTFLPEIRDWECRRQDISLCTILSTTEVALCGRTDLHSGF